MMSHPDANVIDHGVIRCPGDLARLGIVDWHRYKPYWKSPQHVIESVGSRFVNGFNFMVVEMDLREFPKRDDFPKWNHIGNHEIYGRLYWNHFHYTFEGDLQFDDAPDFSGTIFYKDRIPSEYRFWGDIGQVSPITFLETWRFLAPHTLWISVLNEDTQVIIQPLVEVPEAHPMTKIHELLSPFGLLWHDLQTSIFLEHNSKNLYLGEISDLANMSAKQVRRKINSILPGVRIPTIPTKKGEKVVSASAQQLQLF